MKPCRSFKQKMLPENTFFPTQGRNLFLETDCLKGRRLLLYREENEISKHQLSTKN